MSVLEHAVLRITPGDSEAFRASANDAIPIIQRAPGCLRAEIRQQIEDTDVFLLLVLWESVDAHMEFRASEDFPLWRAKTAVFYAAPIDVTHFESPVLGSNVVAN